MKVLVLTNNDGGLFHFRRELLEELLKSHQVLISLPKGQYIDQMIDMGCQYIPCEFDRRGTNPLGDLKQYFFYVRLLKEAKPDVVLTYTIKPNVYGGMACARLGVPYIANVTGLGTSIMNPGIMQKLSLLLYRYGLRKAKKVFFQNNANMRFMQQHGIANANYGLLPGSGVNLKSNPFEEYPDDESQIEFVTVGRIMKDKGTDELLEAAKFIKDRYKNVGFTLVGDFDGNYEERIREAHQAGIVNYVGPQNDVHSFLKRSHATIHPSYHEGLSNVLLETAASGRPILASNVPGCIDTFDDGTSGIAFEPKNALSLIKAIEKFLHLTQAERAEMGRRGREKVEKEFDRNLVIEAYKKTLSEINK